MTAPIVVQRRPLRLPHPAVGAAQRAWLLTFADLVLLLLTFFVLVFSMSEPVRQRYVPMMQSYLEAFAPDIDPNEAGGAPLSFAVAPADARDGVAYLQAALQAAFARSDALDGLQFRATARYLVIEIEAARLFEPGTARISAAAGPMVFDLAGVLGNLANPVAVVGRAAVDPVAPNAAAGWSLGMARADALADAMAAAGYGDDLTILARGDWARAGAEAVEVLVFAEGKRP
jgi:chemotaxis protein MotB